MQPLNIAATKQCISAPRLASYQSFFTPASDAELYGIYYWNDLVSTTMFRVISLLEVTLRNAFHRELSTHFGTLAGSVGTSTSNDWYNLIGLRGTSFESVRKVTHRYRVGQGWIPRIPIPSPDDVVSRLTFGFWRHLLDHRVDQAGNTIPWERILTAKLPNHPNSSTQYWGRQQNQDQLFARMDLIGDFRNRIAHLEPVWKHGELLEERRARHGRQVRVVQGRPSTPAAALTRLRLIHNRTVELLYWISKDRALDYNQTDIKTQFLWLTSMPGLEAYRRLKPLERIPAAFLRKELRSRRLIDTPIEVTRRGIRLGVYYPA